MVADVGGARRIVVAYFDDGASGPVGFLPLALRSSGIAGPLAPGIANVAGIVHAGDPHFDWPEARVLLSQQLAGWRFNRLLAQQVVSLGLAAASSHSLAVADFADGWDSYLGWLSGTHPKWLKGTRAAHRRLAAARGDVCFTYEDPDPAALAWLVRTKRDQCRVRGWKDVYADRFTREFTERSLAGEVDGTTGVLSTLRCNGQIVAAAFGVASTEVHCGSVLAQDPALEKYSLARICLLELSSAVAMAGRQRHDLGEGREAFKEKFANAEVRLASGALIGHGALGQAAGIVAWGGRRVVMFAGRHPLFETRMRQTARQLRRLRYVVDPRIEKLT
jgi:CelD/BcsL family acetyltransferase involved in cellulose biosynthesis